MSICTRQRGRLSVRLTQLNCRVGPKIWLPLTALKNDCLVQAGAPSPKSCRPQGSAGVQPPGPSGFTGLRLSGAREGTHRDERERVHWSAPSCYASPMESTSGKQQILDALFDLQAKATVEDAIERLVFLAKVREGLAQLDAGQSLDHDAVKRRLGL